MFSLCLLIHAVYTLRAPAQIYKNNKSIQNRHLLSFQFPSTFENLYSKAEEYSTGIVIDLILGTNKQKVWVSLSFYEYETSYLISPSCSTCCSDQTLFDPSNGGSIETAETETIHFWYFENEA